MTCGLCNTSSPESTSRRQSSCCEAKNYPDNGNEGLHHAAEALADELSVPYVGVLGTSGRGPLPPAIFYNPDVLTLRSWCNPDDPGVFDDKRNIARFAVNASGPVRETRTEFLAFVRHFNARSGVIRRQEAGLLDRYGRASIPVIGGGDLNSTASGPHFPQRDWTTADYQSRSHKGVIGNDGTWRPDTAAVDHLIGRWDDTTQRRIDGCGFTAIAELEWQNNNTPILPTVNPNVDAGGGLHIDYLLVNEAMNPTSSPAASGSTPSTGRYTPPTTASPPPSSTYSRELPTRAYRSSARCPPSADWHGRHRRSQPPTVERQAPGRVHGSPTPGGPSRAPGITTVLTTHDARRTTDCRTVSVATEACRFCHEIRSRSAPNE